MSVAAAAPGLRPAAPRAPVRPRAADPAAAWSARGAMAVGVLTTLVLVAGFGAWSMLASLAGAVIAPGKLRVETNRQVVQHLDGGVVRELVVREGDTVTGGQVLMRLDGRQLSAELAIVESRLFDAMARAARLEAEQIDAPRPAFEPELVQLAAARTDVAALVEGQRRLHRARAETVARETAQLRERQAQIEEEIAGARAQMASLATQLGFIEKELGDQRSLLERGLTQASRVLALEREKARLEGQLGALTAQIAQGRGRITEIDIQITGREAARREEGLAELRELKVSEAELKERRLALTETLSRLDVKAPRSGTVLGLTVFTEGAVIRPAEPVLYVVPSESRLVVDAAVEPQHIDQVWAGQPARLRFSAFNARTTPEIDGTLRRVSADALTNEQTGQSFYTAEVEIGEAGLAALQGLTLVAGMPVEVFLQTGERSPMSYFLRPFTDFLSRSMRED
jgi:HlyD family secretion protein